MRDSRLNLIITLLSLCLIPFAKTAEATDLYISELVADNALYQDEEGDTPDWIELYNNSDQSIQLEGYYLTDDSGDLTQWRLPAVSIAAQDYLVIFASNKDRTTLGSPLHTNFKLSAGGESVYLVAPDGSTLVDSITYPALAENEAHGILTTGGTQTTMVPLDSGSAAKALIPTSSSLGTTWTQTGFNDDTWLNGTTGVGYDTQSRYQSLINLDVLAMRNVNGSVYIRVPFTLGSFSSASSMILKMKYDDAFVAYLNGIEVTRAGSVPTPLNWNSTASTYHDDGLAEQFISFDISEHLNTIQTGDNVLAIQGLNHELGSSDLLFVPRLELTLSEGVTVEGQAILNASTPGLANAGFAYEGTVEIPEALPARGFYESPITVTLSSATANAKLDIPPMALNLPFQAHSTALLSPLTRQPNCASKDLNQILGNPLAARIPISF